MRSRINQPRITEVKGQKLLRAPQLLIAKSDDCRSNAHDNEDLSRRSNRNELLGNFPFSREKFDFNAAKTTQRAPETFVSFPGFVITTPLEKQKQAKKTKIIV
jgi:hypothetical protein